MHQKLFYSKERKVYCKKCGRHFRNRHVYAGHAKIHIKSAIEGISKSRLGNLNPAKRWEVRAKISEAGKGRIPWNKNKRWIKSKRHDRIVNQSMKYYKDKGFITITTDFYVPDAIIIDFRKKEIKAFELNPGSVISKGLRAKEKGYCSLIVKIRRTKKYQHKNTDKEIPIKDFYV